MTELPHMFSVIPARRLWYGLSGLAALGSGVALLVWGLRPGIDFTGGSLIDLRFVTERPPIAEVRQLVEDATGASAVTVQPTGQQGMVLRFPQIGTAVHEQLLSQLREKYPGVTELRFDAIGPTIGRELRRKTVWAVSLAVAGMITYISLAFRKVKRPVPSWQYGGIAIVALLHDMLITAGVFAVFGRFYGLEVNAPFVAAMLTVFGYSVNDTIVVFDRIRDNLLHRPSNNFAELVDGSIKQTIARSTNTSLATLLVLLSILTFGGDTIRDFTLALIIGIVVGTYSSIFVASPLLVDVRALTLRMRRGV